jgi:hypothetical protein
MKNTVIKPGARPLKKQIKEKQRGNQNLVNKDHTLNQLPSAKRNNRSRFLKIKAFCWMDNIQKNKKTEQKNESNDLTYTSLFIKHHQNVES